MAVMDHGQQDEWTPYVAYPPYTADDLSHHMKCKLPDQAGMQILRKNDSHANEIVFKNNFLPTLNQNITQVVYDKLNNKKQKEEQTCNTIDRLDTKFKSERTRKIWKKLEKSCTSKSRTRWKDSLEGTYFLQVLHVEKRFISCEAKENEKVSKYHVQPCNCMDFRASNENVKKLDSLTGSDEECNSPCCCPKYFTSKSGLVFESLDEKLYFDEKMDKMNELFASELLTIKEQHTRLRVDFLPKMTRGLVIEYD